MLTPTLITPINVLHKLEREMHRAFHHEHDVHKADHLYNFCITALSLKDHVLKHLDVVSKQDKEPYYEEWSNALLLRAATEIANTAKHRVLKREPQTRDVERSSSIIINVYHADNGELKNLEKEVEDYTVLLADDTEVQVFNFTSGLIDYWKDYFLRIGIEYVHQGERVYFGLNDEDELMFPEDA